MQQSKHPHRGAHTRHTCARTWSEIDLFCVPRRRCLVSLTGRKDASSGCRTSSDSEERRSKTLLRSHLWVSSDSHVTDEHKLQENVSADKLAGIRLR